MMLLVFSKAKGVVAWLGLSNDAAEETLLQDVANSQRRFFAPTDQVATDQLIKRPWFSRTWVRQEVFAATNLTIQLGAVCCDWDSFSSFIWGHDKSRAGYLKSLRQMYSTMKPNLPENFVRAPQHYSSGNGDAGKPAQVRLAINLLSIMTDNRHFQVSDPRDRVYGLLGVLQNQTAVISEALPIDVSRTVEQVYQDFTKYLINVTGSLDFLSVFRCSSPTHGLASWALDWRIDCDKLFFLLFRDFPAEFLGQAQRQRYEDDDRLLITGRCLGVVTSPSLESQPKQQHSSIRRLNIVLEPLEPRLVNLIESGIYASRRFRYPGSDVESWGSLIAAPSSTEVDDLIVELEGSQLPLLLRQKYATAEGKAFSLIGPVWLQFPRNEFSHHSPPGNFHCDVANILCHRSFAENGGLRSNPKAEFAGGREFCQRYKELRGFPMEHHYLV